MTTRTWQVTAVQGRDPMKEPSIQSAIATPHTPHAMLIPDQGTTPMRRRIERRTQGDERDFVPDMEPKSPSRTLRVMSRALGKKYVRNGARGVESSVAQTEPIMVSVVRRMVAEDGEKSAPASTF